MKQNYIFFAVILLVTLSVVNALPHQLLKRDTTFAPCPTGSPNVIEVVVQPDPPPVTGKIDLTITGTLKEGVISMGSQLIIGAIDDNGNPLSKPLVTDLCGPDGFDNCPVNSFSMIEPLTTTDLVPTYSIIVEITDAYGQTLACSIGTVTGN
ncbi:hypothetical protein RclHR1_03640004 [Rhizophagus clarus]|uniref:Phosphatidylglycerol/phosphatidylinositol transfer protein n=1 Tax=Rhizophagus clarus TaxID=94130 RepID=A0A2Z6S6L8_9GLOM|nr:hypothetical protein RclHR1_03640004 [Rhizophagus clarus]GES76250.1 hypothetical protein GLOIN_2v1771726 [Rhizophagus clarus]